MTKLSRSQTPEEKLANGEFILQVAERIIRDEGLDALSMNRLVQETGFAKGTPYLYFTTRHEILASLFVQMLTDQLASSLVWAFYTAALGAAKFPQSPNMRAPFRLRCAKSKRRCALTHYSAIWWINLHPNLPLRRPLLH